MDVHNTDEIPIKAKRGRPRSKNILKLEVSHESTEPENIKEPSIPKKRGRKPKGGKIVPQNILTNDMIEIKPNVILHLKCSIRDLLDNSSGFNIPVNNDTFNFSHSNNDLVYEIIENPNDKQILNSDDMEAEHNTDINHIRSTNLTDDKEIWRKLKQLEKDLHLNNISNTKSCCFWCTCDFDNPPIYIPSHFIRDTYQVYGCFCTPECAVAHLMNQNLDSSVKFERYSLINNIYCKIFEHSKNIKPAPNPHYILDKFYGNMTIQEYRSLLKSDRLFLIIDKPIAKVMPEIHEDDDEYMINNKIIPSNNYQVKKRIQKKQPKTTILNENFGLAK